MEDVLNNPYFLGAAVLTLGNTVLLIILAWRFSRYQKRQTELLKGEEVGNLAEIVLKHKKLLVSHNKNLRELGEILAELVENNKFNIQKVGMVRFNPFEGTGGNMSFALALLDGQDNGIVISSLHSREGTRIYAKPLQGGQSKYNLTQEEKEAMAKANILKKLDS